MMRCTVAAGVAGVLLALLGGLAAGCGGGAATDDGRPRLQARPYTAKAQDTGRTARVTAAAFRAPIAAYRRHVRRQLAAMLRDVRALR